MKRELGSWAALSFVGKTVLEFVDRTVCEFVGSTVCELGSWATLSCSSDSPPAAVSRLTRAPLYACEQGKDGRGVCVCVCVGNTYLYLYLYVTVFHVRFGAFLPVF